MTADRIVHLMAGSMILASLALTHFHDSNWMWLTAFVGLNLAQSGVTNFCPLSSLLKKAKVAEGSGC
ncbi:MAG: DUF2892 domain-containing protein [Gammaproteobacteria bacterium]|nr:DUF2892 domain-containing protein [Gammaproteobacteria bacterium]